MRKVRFANRFARVAGLTNGDGLDDAVARMATAQRARRRESARHATTQPATPFTLGGYEWFGRVEDMGDGLDLVLCVRARLRRRELLSAFQTTYALSDRQAAVLNQILHAHPAKRIARELGISEVTARGHTAIVLGALGVETKLELMRLAERVALGEAELSSPRRAERLNGAKAGKSDDEPSPEE